MLAFTPDELRADFQQTYNLNLDDMGDGYSVAHAAALAEMLPAATRVRVRLAQLMEEMEREEKAKDNYTLSVDEYKAMRKRKWKEA